METAVYPERNVRIKSVSDHNELVFFGFILVFQIFAEISIGFTHYYVGNSFRGTTYHFDKRPDVGYGFCFRRTIYIGVRGNIRRALSQSIGEKRQVLIGQLGIVCENAYIRVAFIREFDTFRFKFSFKTFRA